MPKIAHQLPSSPLVCSCVLLWSVCVHSYNSDIEIERCKFDKKLLMTGDRRFVRLKILFYRHRFSRNFVVSRIIASIMSKRGRADSRSQTPARITTRPKSSHGAGSWLESKVPTPEPFPPPPPLPIDNTASTASASNLSGAALPQGIIQSSTGPNDSWIVFVNGKWTEINTSLYCTMCNAQVEYSTCLLYTSPSPRD